MMEVITMMAIMMLDRILLNFFNMDYNPGMLPHASWAAPPSACMASARTSSWKVFQSWLSLTSTPSSRMAVVSPGATISL